MEFLTNVYNPTMPDAITKVFISLDETQQEAWEKQERWLSDKILGLPQETDTHTVQELVKTGIVGVYLPDEENQHSDR